jgi:SPASM domain peptide maturase of grasp-with-spasm system
MTGSAPAPYFRLFACCLPVRGAARSVICDVQRGALVPISNALYDVITACARQPVARVFESWEAAAAEVMRVNLAGLVERELGFWCEDPDEFPEMSLDWDRPSTITNAVVELSPTTVGLFPSIVRQLEELGCAALELRSYRPFPLTVLEDVLRQLESSHLSSIELLLCHSTEATEAALRALLAAHTRISRAVIHSAPHDRVVRSGVDLLVFQTAAVQSADHCGFVHPTYFAVTLEAFAESHSCNSCLNRKLAVDGQGEIRNCPALPAAYGNVSQVPLRTAVDRPEFRALWSIRKDDVDVCRDCEFRYVCTDCRALLRDPANRLSKPKHCGYDPYQGRWDAAPLAGNAAGGGA